MSGNNKMYGLLAPKKGALQPRHAVFGDDDSPDESRGGVGPVAQAQARKSRAAAPELDSALLQYDEYHDELERERAEQQKARREGAKARYIPLLMQQADRRKKEAERRAERLVQKEREAEGDQFRDKETFVTSSYRKKVEEFARMDAEDKLRDRIEELADVTKQKDLGAFYGSLYKQTVDVNDVKVKLEDEGKTDDISEGKISSKKSRHYRKRKNSSSSEEHSDDTNEIDEEVVETLGHKARNGSEERRDKFSYRRRDNELSKSTSKQKKLRETRESKTDERIKGPRDSSHVDGGVTDTASRKCVESGSEEGEIREDEERNTNGGEGSSKVEVQLTRKLEPVENVSVSQVEKVNIWEKHTVGEVFEAAVQRYWQRKAARDAARAVTK